jgi:hypothetical protein
MNPTEDEVIGQLATDAVERGYLTMVHPDNDHPAFAFWLQQTGVFGVPLVLLMPDPTNGHAAVTVELRGVVADPAIRRKVDLHIEKVLRRHTKCERHVEPECIVIGPLRTDIARDLASKLARSSGVRFPLIDMKKVR